MIFAFYYVSAMVLVAAETRGMLRPRGLQTPNWTGELWIAVIVVAYAVQIALCDALAQHGPWPLAVVRWQDDAAGAVAALLLLALVQSYALLGLYRSRVKVGWLVLGAALMALFSFAPVLTSSDLYAYVGNGLLGRGAYAPPNAPFYGEFSAINVWWHVPVPAATYGPLWLTVAHGITTLAPTLALNMTLLRVLGLVSFGALAALLRAYGVPARILATIALNPALYFEFVLNAHNDVLPVAITIAAAILAPAWPVVASLLIVAAALVKAPFVLLGLPVLARVRATSERAVAVAVAVAVSAAASWFAGGAAYARALMQYTSASGLANAVHAIAAIAALVVLATAIAGTRRPRTAVWLLPMFGVYTAPWYALWSVPYALASRRVLTYLAIWLPFVSFLTEPALTRVWTVAAVIPVVVVLAFAPPRRDHVLQGGPS